MKFKDQRNLNCPDKKHLLGLDVYFNHNKIYVVSRKRLVGDKTKVGSQSFREVIYKQDRPEPGICGIASINGQVNSELFLDMFRTVVLLEKKEGSFLMALSLEIALTGEQTAVPNLIKIEEHDKHLLEGIMDKTPNFFTKDYDIPLPLKKPPKLLGPSHLSEYPFNTYWSVGDPALMCVVQNLSTK